MAEQEYFGEGMLYTLEDENGNTQEFELLGELEWNGGTYCALIPYYENADDLLNDSGEFVVLKKEIIDGEEMFTTIDDDDEYEEIGNIFLEDLNQYFNEDEDDETYNEETYDDTEIDEMNEDDEDITDP